MLGRSNKNHTTQVKIFNPYSANLWGKPTLILNKSKATKYKKIINSIENSNKCIKVSELQKIFQDNVSNNPETNKKLLHNKSIKSYLENLTGKEFPAFNYSFSVCSRKSSDRYTRIIGIRVKNKKGKEIEHICNIDDAYELGPSELLRELKRIRAISLLNKIKRHL